MNNCSNCGAPLNQGDVFCKNCGTNTNQVNVQNNMQQNQNINNLTGNINLNQQPIMENVNNVNGNFNLNQQNINSQPMNLNQENMQPMNQPINNNGQDNNQNVDKNSYNIKAIGSIVCPIIAWFVFWWLAFVGIGLGATALTEIKKTNQKGKTLAYIGIGLAVVELLLYFIGMSSK